MAVTDKVVEAPDAEELELTKLVFGDLEGFHASLGNVDALYEGESDEEMEEVESSSDDEVQDDDLFVIDEEGDDNLAMEIDSDAASDSEDDAWHDSDDERIEVALSQSNKLKKLRKSEEDNVILGTTYVHRLRSQFEKIYPKPEWVAALDEENESNSEDDDDDMEDDAGADLAQVLAQSTKFVVNSSLKLIAANHLDIARLKDANQQKRSKGSIQSISFHPTHPLLLTAGFDRTVRLFHIDGATNPFITSVHFRNTPIASCQFAPGVDGQTVVYAGGRRRYMNRWDVNSGEVDKISRLYGHEDHQKSFEYFKVSPKGTYIGLTGNSGWCNLLNPSGQWSRGMKVEGTVKDLAFTQDESLCLVANTAGEIWEFALNKTSVDHKGAVALNKNISQVVRKWQDDGVSITKIAFGGANDRWLAVGSKMGIVNIYDRAKLVADIDAGKTPTPMKSVDNLVTTISTLEFSPDGQLLMMASRAKRDQLRIVHLPSGSVYQNWPTSGTPLGKVTCAKFAPDNSMVAIGNEQAKVTLWRLNHF